METVRLSGKIPHLSLFGFHIPNISLFEITVYESRATWEADIYRHRL